MAPYKGKRRAADEPNEIAGLQPESSFSETAKQAERRQRDLATPRTLKASQRTFFWRRFAIVAAIVVAFIGTGVALAGYMYWRSIDDSITAKLDKVDPTVKLALKPPATPSQPFYAVLMGVDTRPDDPGSRSDTLLVAYIDPPRKRITMVSIPRDTRAQIPGHGTMKINAAYQLGGPSLVVQTVKRLTGVEPSHFIQVDFNGFKDLVDAIGGVYVNVPTRIFDPRAAGHDFTAEIIEPGYKKLDGKHALTFARSRKFPEGDIARIRNQQILLRALAKQTLQIQNVFRINAIITAVTKNITTDMNLGQLATLASEFSGGKPDTVRTVTIPADPKYIDGVSYVITDEEKVKELFQDIEAGEVVGKSEGTATAEAAAKVVSVKPSQVTLTVRNGTKEVGVAKNAAAFLGTKGFRVGEVGNTTKPVYAQTFVVYKSNNGDKAKLVAESLGMGKLVASKGRYSFTSDVLLVVGADYVPPAGAAAQPAQ